MMNNSQLRHLVAFLFVVVNFPNLAFGQGSIPDNPPTDTEIILDSEDGFIAYQKIMVTPSGGGPEVSYKSNLTRPGEAMRPNRAVTGVVSIEAKFAATKNAGLANVKLIGLPDGITVNETIVDSSTKAFTYNLVDSPAPMTRILIALENVVTDEVIVFIPITWTEPGPGTDEGTDSTYKPIPIGEPGPSVQRKCYCCDDKEETETIENASNAGAYCPMGSSVDGGTSDHAVNSTTVAGGGGPLGIDGGGGGFGATPGGDVTGGGANFNYRTNDLSASGAAAASHLNFRGTAFQEVKLHSSGGFVEVVKSELGTAVLTDQPANDGHQIEFYGPGDDYQTDEPQIVRRVRRSALGPNTWQLRTLEKRFNHLDPVGAGSVVENRYVQEKLAGQNEKWTLFLGADLGSGISDLDAAESNAAPEDTFLRKIVTEKVWGSLGGDDLETQIVTVWEKRADTGVWEIVSKTQNKYRHYYWGSPLVEQTIGFGTENLTRNWKYYSTSNYGQHRLGRLFEFQNFSGYEARFDYDTEGRTKSVLETFKDLQLNKSHSFEYGLDGSSRIEKTMVGSDVVSKRFIERETLTLFPSGTSERTTVVNAVTATATATDPANLVTSITRRNDDGPLASQGRVTERLFEDGTRASYDYSSVQNPFSPAGPSNWKLVIAKLGSGAGSSERGDMTKSWFDPMGNLRKQETHSLDFEGVAGNSQHLETLELQSLDGLGRPTQFIRSFEAPGGSAPDSQTSYRIYACCGLRSETDYRGIVTEYHYDHLVRRETVTTLGLTIGTQYNGKTIRSVRIPESDVPLDSHGHKTTRLSVANPFPASTIITSEGVFDEAAQLVTYREASSQSDDGDDAATLESTSISYDYSSGKRKVTIVHPDAGTEERLFFKDGSLQKVEGDSVNNLYFDYGTSLAGVTFGNAGILGVKITEAKPDGTLGEGTQWRVVLMNFLGQHARTVFADGSFADAFYKSGRGHLIREVDPDGVITHYSYNSKGERVFRASSLDGNSNLDFGVDRVDYCKTDACITSNGDYGYRQVCGVYRDSSDTSSDPYAPDGLVTSVREVSIDGLEQLSKPFNDPNRLAVVETVLAGGADWATTSIAASGRKTISTYTDGLLTNRIIQGSNGVEVISNTTFGYDDYLRVNLVNDARKGDTSFSYWNSDRLRSSILLRGAGTSDDLVTSYTYDDEGRVTSRDLPDTTTGPFGGTSLTNITAWSYDKRGNVKSESGGQTYYRTYEYDGLSRLTKLGSPQGLITSGPFTGFPDPATWSYTFWNFDSLRGWLDNKRYDDGSGGQGLGPDYTYTPGGRLSTRQWARSGSNAQRMATTYAYDFNTNGNASRAGDLVHVLYSNLNNRAPDFNLSFSYTRWGAHSTVTDVLGLRSYTYRESVDLQLETEDAFGKRLTRTYDNLGRPSELQLGTSTNPTSDHVCGQTYDDQTGRYEKITHGAVTTADAEFAYGYRANSHLVQTITASNEISGSLVGNHVVTNFHETYRDLVTQTRARVGSTDRSRNDYVYNQIGQRTRVIYDGSIMGGPDGSFYYHYNSKGELAKAQRHANPNYGQTSGYTNTRDYNYDEMGNRLGVDYIYHPPNPDTVTSLTYSPNVLNQYEDITTAGTTVSKSHDDDGNLIDDGDKVYEWDGENRLRRVSRKSDGVQIAEYYYDYRGRRIYKSTSTIAAGGESSILFYYDGWNLIAEYDYGSTVSLLRKYTWGTDLSGTKQGAGGVGGLLCVEDSEGKHFPTYDANGNVVAVLGDDASATGQAWYTYDAFGRIFGTGGAYKDKLKFKFSTKYHDEETGFYYYGYRYYDPVTGRWPSRDPIEESGGIGIYVFVGNDPIRFSDYLGLAVPSHPPGGGGGGPGGSGGAAGAAGGAGGAGAAAAIGKKSHAAWKKINDARMAKCKLMNFDYGKYLRGLIGNPPAGMKNPHAHHILYKSGIGKKQKALVEEGQELLTKYKIDPFKGKENLTWAPNCKGQHTVPNLTKVVEALRKADKKGTREAMVEALRKMGEAAAGRRGRPLSPGEGSGF